MKARDIAFLAAALVLLSGVALVVWKPGSTGGVAVDLATDRPAPAAAEPGPGPAVPLESEAPPVVAAEPRIPRPAEHGDQRHGAIRGHIALSADVVQSLRFVHVRIQEALAGNGDAGDHEPFQLTLREDIAPNLGTPE